MGRKTRMRRLKRSSDQGWGLFETLLAVVLSAILSGVVAMGTRQALDSANARDCCKNLALIEAAKDEFTRDNPGVPLTSVSQLATYFKYGIPACPSGGAYEHVTDLNQKVTCSLGANVNKANYHTIGP